MQIESVIRAVGISRDESFVGRIARTREPVNRAVLGPLSGGYPARQVGRWPALLITSVLFGLAHFNKRAVYFNWRYVLLAAIAGFFYGRAWRQERRVGASAVTHASVDAIWSLWLK